MRRRGIFFFAAFLLSLLSCFLLCGAAAYGADVPSHTSGAGRQEKEDLEKEAEDAAERMLEELEFGEIDEGLQKLFPDERLDFKEVLMGVLSGDMQFTAGLLNRLVADQLTYAIRSCRENLVHILFLAVIAAVFANFGKVFQNKQISEVSFYILYMLMIALPELFPGGGRMDERRA